MVEKNKVKEENVLDVLSDIGCSCCGDDEHDHHHDDINVVDVKQIENPLDGIG